MNSPRRHEVFIFFANFAVNFFELAVLAGKTTWPINRADPLAIPFLALPLQPVLALLQLPVLVPERVQR